MIDIKLEAYEGPLDLLLRLIQRSEIDIYDIPISQLTEDYMEVITALPPDMEQMSEFLVMAATLLEIKSKMLLPRPKSEEAEESDPREELARRLIAYQQAQLLSERLRGLTPVGERLTGAGDRELISAMSNPAVLPELVEALSIPNLIEIFSDIMRRCESRVNPAGAGYGEMPRERFTVTDKTRQIIETLREKGRISLSALFSLCRDRREMVVTFLALLEMARQGLILASQRRAFEDVEVVRCPA